MSRKEPDDRDLHEMLRKLDRRVSRLEDTQVTEREINESFERVHGKIGDLKSTMNQRFDSVEATMTQCFDVLNAKFDLVIKHLEERDANAWPNQQHWDRNSNSTRATGMMFRKPPQSKL